MVSRKPHERAHGGLGQAGVLLSLARTSLGLDAAASAVLREALRVEIGEEAVVLGLLWAEALPESTYLSADVGGVAGRVRLGDP